MDQEREIRLTGKVAQQAMVVFADSTWPFGERVLTTACLKSNLVALWLTLVPVRRLKKEKQERVLLF